MLTAYSLYIYYYAEAAITLYTNKLYTHTSKALTIRTPHGSVYTLLLQIQLFF